MLLEETLKTIDDYVAWSYEDHHFLRSEYDLETVYCPIGIFKDDLISFACGGSAKKCIKAVLKKYPDAVIKFLETKQYWYDTERKNFRSFDEEDRNDPYFGIPGLHSIFKQD